MASQSMSMPMVLRCAMRSARSSVSSSLACSCLRSRLYSSSSVTRHATSYSSSSSSSSSRNTPPPQSPQVAAATEHNLETFYDQDEEHRVAVNNLLYDTPTIDTRPRKRTLCALVSNEAGVLSRVSGVLAGRGVNIDSLVVSETETKGLSRMTIVLRGGEQVDAARKALEELVQTFAVVEFAPHAPVVERELLLVKLSIVPPKEQRDPQSASQALARPYPTTASAALDSHIQRQAIVELTNLFGGKVLDLTTEFILIELVGKTIRLDAFIELCRPFGIRELARSGALAMLRSSITNVQSKGKQGGEDKTKEVDPSLLPPG